MAKAPAKKPKPVLIRNKRTGKTRTAGKGVSARARKAIAEGKDEFRGGFLGLRKFKVKDDGKAKPKKTTTRKKRSSAPTKQAVKTSPKPKARDKEEVIRRAREGATRASYANRKTKPKTLVTKSARPKARPGYPLKSKRPKARGQGK